jgi:hypothetical protein
MHEPKGVQIAIRLSNLGRRDAVDVALHAELRVSHGPALDAVTRTVIRLPLNSAWMPRLRRSGEARIRIEEALVSSVDWNRLEARASIAPASVAEILQGNGSASVRFYALASDPFSGSRQVFVSRDYYAADLALQDTEKKLLVGETRLVGSIKETDPSGLAS